MKKTVVNKNFWQVFCECWLEDSGLFFTKSVHSACWMTSAKCATIISVAAWTTEWPLWMWAKAQVQMTDFTVRVLQSDFSAMLFSLGKLYFSAAISRSAACWSRFSTYVNNFFNSLIWVSAEKNHDLPFRWKIFKWNWSESSPFTLITKFYPKEKKL